MALQLNKELPSGIEISQAYHRISLIEFTHNSFIIYLKVYASQQAAIDLKDPLEVETIICQNDEASITKYVVGTGAESNNVISRGYHYLKTKVPRFQSAQDV